MRATRNNTPGTVPAIIRPDQILGLGLPRARRSPRLNNEPPIEAPIITINSTAKRAPNQIPLYSLSIISQEAVNHITDNVYYKEKQQPWLPRSFITSSPTQINGSNLDVDIEHFCAPVVHPVTGETITQYRKLMKDPITKEVWTTAWGKEWGRMYVCFGHR